MAVKQNLHHYMDSLAANNHFNGAVLVAYKGDVLLNKGYGFSTYQYDIPNTSQTKFRIGSLTKAFTAAAVLILHKQGKLNLGDTIDTYIEDFTSSKNISVHHLLSHTSGVADFTLLSDYWENTMRLPTNLEKSVNWIKRQPLQFEPGKKMQYSNAGYLLLTAIIEKTSGMSYEQFLQERILKPLQLKNTGADNGRTVVKHLATGYSVWEEVIQTEFVDMSIPQGAYGLYSTVEDLYRWASALKDGLLLDDHLQANMFTSYLDSYGYGWFIENFPKQASHSGDINGFTNDFRIYFDEDLIVIVLSNISLTPVARISDDLSNIAFEKNVQVDGKINFSKEFIPYSMFTGKYKNEDFVILIECHKDKLFVTLPKTYGALYKYELKPVQIAQEKAYFKADFVNEDFTFDLEDKTLQFVDVNSQKHFFKKI